MDDEFDNEGNLIRDEDKKDENAPLKGKFDISEEDIKEKEKLQIVLKNLEIKLGEDLEGQKKSKRKRIKKKKRTKKKKKKNQM